MKENFKSKFEKLNNKLFEPIPSEELSKLKGGGHTTNTMPTADRGTTTADTEPDVHDGCPCSA